MLLYTSSVNSVYLKLLQYFSESTLIFFRRSLKLSIVSQRNDKLSSEHPLFYRPFLAQRMSFDYYFLYSFIVGSAFAPYFVKTQQFLIRRCKHFLKAYLRKEPPFHMQKYFHSSSGNQSDLATDITNTLQCRVFFETITMQNFL